MEIPVEFDRTHLNVSLPSVAKLPSMAYVSMQERVMTGGSFGMPIVHSSTMVARVPPVFLQHSYLALSISRRQHV